MLTLDKCRSSAQQSHCSEVLTTAAASDVAHPSTTTLHHATAATFCFTCTLHRAIRGCYVQAKWLAWALRVPYVVDVSGATVCFIWVCGIALHALSGATLGDDGSESAGSRIGGALAAFCWFAVPAALLGAHAKLCGVVIHRLKPFACPTQACEVDGYVQL